MTIEQVWHFTAFGYLPLPKLFTREEMLPLREEFDAVLRLDTPDWDGNSGAVASDICARGPLLRQLLLDERVYDIPRKILGDDFILEAADGSMNVNDTPWHGGGQVTQKPTRSIKLSFYLEDELMADSGCLRLMPMAHRNYLEQVDARWLGVPDWTFPLRNRQVGEAYRPYGLKPEDVPCIAIESELGDGLLFSEDLPHAAFHATSGRRQIHLAFMNNPTGPEQEIWIKHRVALGMGLRPPRAFVGSDDERLRKMVQPLVALGIEPISHQAVSESTAETAHE